MATARPPIDLSKCQIRPGFVKAAASIRKGFAVKIDSFNSDGTPILLEAAAVTDNAIGIALDAGAAGVKIRVALWGQGTCDILVGTGGCTAGAPLKFVSDGATTATVGGGSVKQVIIGQALETGVAADLVPVNLGAFGWSVSA